MQIFQQRMILYASDAFRSTVVRRDRFDTFAGLVLLAEGEP